MPTTPIILMDDFFEDNSLLTAPPAVIHCPDGAVPVPPKATALFPPHTSHTLTSPFCAECLTAMLAIATHANPVEALLRLSTSQRAAECLTAMAHLRMRCLDAIVDRVRERILALETANLSAAAAWEPLAHVSPILVSALCSKVLGGLSVAAPTEGSLPVVFSLHRTLRAMSAHDIDTLPANLIAVVVCMIWAGGMAAASDRRHTVRGVLRRARGRDPSLVTRALEAVRRGCHGMSVMVVTPEAFRYIEEMEHMHQTAGRSQPDSQEQSQEKRRKLFFGGSQFSQEDW